MLYEVITVDERSYIEFPELSDLTLNQLIDGHTAVVGEVNALKESMSELEKSNMQLGLGVITSYSIHYTKLYDTAITSLEFSFAFEMIDNN